MDEWLLLRQYVEENSQTAFAGLVERYINLVYTTCLREVHDAVATLACATGVDDGGLHELAARAFEQLQAVSRALR